MRELKTLSGKNRLGIHLVTTLHKNVFALSCAWENERQEQSIRRPAPELIDCVRSALSYASLHMRLSARTAQCISRALSLIIRRQLNAFGMCLHDFPSRILPLSYLICQ